MDKISQCCPNNTPSIGFLKFVCLFFCVRKVENTMKETVSKQGEKTASKMGETNSKRSIMSNQGGENPVTEVLRNFYSQALLILGDN